MIHDIVFFHIKNRFRPDMTERDLYEAVRGEWRIGVRRNKVRYAFAVANNRVQGVFAVRQWKPVDNRRWQFTGKSADDLWDKCEGREKVMGRTPFRYGNLAEFLAKSR